MYLRLRNLHPPRDRDLATITSARCDTMTETQKWRNAEKRDIMRSLNIKITLNSVTNDWFPICFSPFRPIKTVANFPPGFHGKSTHAIQHHEIRIHRATAIYQWTAWYGDKSSKMRKQSKTRHHNEFEYPNDSELRNEWLIPNLFFAISNNKDGYKLLARLPWQIYLTAEHILKTRMRPPLPP